MLNHPVVGQRRREQLGALTALLVGREADEAARARVVAALAALERPLVALQTTDRLLLRRVLLPIAVAALRTTRSGGSAAKNELSSDAGDEQIVLSAKMRFCPEPRALPLLAASSPTRFAIGTSGTRSRWQCS